ncbi:MAG: hypothetical protein ACREKL_17405, partial [Chthoniobacterales bacterium]
CEIVDCDIVSQGFTFQLASARQTLVRRCRLAGGRGGGYNLWAFEEGLFEENDITGADLSATYGGTQGFIRNSCFRANRWHGAFGQEDEALTFDTPYEAEWIGTDFRLNGRDLTLGTATSGRGSILPSLAPRMLVAVIIGGPGLGQVERVESIRGKEIRLAGEFSVPFGTGSLLAIVVDKSRVLVVDNVFEDASVAIQLYSQAHAFVIARNRCARTGDTYAMAGQTAGMPGHFSFAFFNQWLDNTFEQSAGNDLGPYGPGFVGIVVSRERPANASTVALGNRFARNQLLGGATMGVVVGINTPPEGDVPASRDEIFEANRIARQPLGIVLESGDSFDLLRDNIFEDVRRGYRDDGHGNLILPPIAH